MTVEELYAQIGGDYSEALKRLANDELIARFIVKFADDGSCSSLIAAWREGDETAAFEAAHMAKGVCANLSLTKLADLASTITEALRPGNEALRNSTDVDALVAELAEVHAHALEAIRAFHRARRRLPGKSLHVLKADFS